MINVRISITSPNYLKYDGWRCLHTAEGGYSNPVGMPAVRPGINAPSVDFTRDMQIRSWEINDGRLTKNKWRALYASATAFTNDHSWPDQVCVDFVNGLDIGAAYPRLMKGILMGGGFYRPRREGSYLIFEPGISAIDATKPIPSSEEIKQKHWYFHAVTTGEKIYNFPHCGIGIPVLVPYFLKTAVKFPIAWFEPWRSNELPDPLRIYNGN